MSDASLKKKSKNAKGSDSIPLSTSVEQALEVFFDHLDGQDTTDIYDLVMSQVEGPMLKAVMKHADSNQTKAAELLGLNRGTLRKKLKQYELI